FESIETEGSNLCFGQGLLQFLDRLLVEALIEVDNPRIREVNQDQPLSSAGLDGILGNLLDDQVLADLEAVLVIAFFLPLIAHAETIIPHNDVYLVLGL